MALVKICPTCQEKNDPQDMMCSGCLGDISGIIPVEYESGGGKDSVEGKGQEEKPPGLSTDYSGIATKDKGTRFIKLRTADGESFAVCNGDVVGRKSVGENVLGKLSTVSRKHVRFTFENGVWYMEDLRSTNETYVNDMRMLPGEKVEVKDKARVSLSSSCSLVVEVPAD